MKPLKREKDALAAMLQNGAESPEALAEQIFNAVDVQRGERNYSYALVKTLIGYTIIGPFSTDNQAEKAAAKHPAAERAWVVPGFTPEGLDRLIRETDEPATGAFDPAIAEDAQLVKLGWKGKRKDRDQYVQMLALK